MKKMLRLFIELSVILLLGILAHIFDQEFLYAIGLAVYIVISDLIAYLKRPDGELQIDNDNAEKTVFRIVLYKDPEDLSSKKDISLTVLNDVHLE